MIDDREVRAYRSQHTVAVLAYLLVESERAHDRRFLAGMIWPGVPLADALVRLRQTLFRLRRQTGSDESGQAHLLRSLNEVQANPDSGRWVDALVLTQLVTETREHCRAAGPMCGSCVERLQHASDIYGGPFLKGLSMRDSAEFDNWQMATQERMHGLVVAALARLGEHWEQMGELGRADASALRAIELDSTDESAYRRHMRMLALTGQRAKALHAYTHLETALQDTTSSAPSHATSRLRDRIRADDLQAARTVPAQMVLTAAAPTPLSTSHAYSARFVGRDTEIRSLQGTLSTVVAGDGQVAFVSGEAGSGKSTLLHEFRRRALEADPELLIASGAASSHVGTAVPYQPFREAFRVLAGLADLSGDGYDDRGEQARRLALAAPEIAQALSDYGPLIRDVFLAPANHHLAAARTPGYDESGSTEKASEASSEHTETSGRNGPVSGRPHEDVTRGGLSQPPQEIISLPGLLDHVTRFLRHLSNVRPIVIILDDMQWTGTASAGLLFHLCRRLSGHRLMIVCAYRPEQVMDSATDQASPHPLSCVVNELLAGSAAMRVDLDDVDGRAFVDSLVDSEPNAVPESTRARIAELTGGIPLFAVDFLHDTIDRELLVRGADGRWRVGADPTWDRLPPRVESLVGARVAQLARQDRAILHAASVQGDVFIAEIVADVLGMSEDGVISRLSASLRERHRLVRVHSVGRIGEQCRTRFQFRHSLYAHHIYGGLDEVTRLRMHEATGRSLERRCRFDGVSQERTSVDASLLAGHFAAAGMHEQATAYYLVAGKAAYRLSANKEAMEAFEHGLDQVQKQPPSSERDRAELALLLALSAPMRALKSYGGEELGRIYARACQLADRAGTQESRYASKWLYASHQFFHAQYGHLLDFTCQMSANTDATSCDGPTIDARTRIGQGSALLMLGDPESARACFDMAGEECESANETTLISPLARTLPVIEAALSTWASWSLGHPDQALAKGGVSVAMAQELGHPYSMAFARAVGSLVVHMLRRECRQLLDKSYALEELSQEQGFAGWHAWALAFRGSALVEYGETLEGVDILERGVEAYCETGQRWALTMLQAMRAHAYLETGAVATGLDALAEANHTMRETGERFYESEIHRLHAGLLALKAEVGQDRPSPPANIERAGELLRRACLVARRQHARSFELRAATDAVRLARRTGSDEVAMPRLRAVYEWFTEGHDTLDLQEAQMVLDSQD